MTPSRSGLAEVVVIGSINADISVRVEQFPEVGQTVVGSELLTGGGGKGANQAVAAARLGRSVAMIGAVGNDGSGLAIEAAMVADGVDMAGVSRRDDVPTGTALIEVDASGENRIIVVAGANGWVGAEALAGHEELLGAAKVLMMQFETSPSIVPLLAGRARSGVLMVNPAPAQSGVDFAGVDLVVPNRSELAELTGAGPTDLDHASHDEVVDRARSLSGTPTCVIVTLGTDGALVVDASTGVVEVATIPAESVEAVDTTAAGDAFCAGLADALCGGSSYLEAARWGAKVAAVTVTRRGAQASLPTTAQLEASGYYSA